jgi:hypothetical protein
MLARGLRRKRWRIFTDVRAFFVRKNQCNQWTVLFSMRFALYYGPPIFRGVYSMIHYYLVQVPVDSGAVFVYPMMVEKVFCS